MKAFLLRELCPKCQWEILTLVRDNELFEIAGKERSFECPECGHKWRVVPKKVEAQ